MTIRQLREYTGICSFSVRSSVNSLRRQCRIVRERDPVGTKREWRYSLSVVEGERFSGEFYHVRPAFKSSHRFHVVLQRPGCDRQVRMTSDPRTLEEQNHYARELDKIALAHPQGRRG